MAEGDFVTTNLAHHLQLVIDGYFELAPTGNNRIFFFEVVGWMLWRLLADHFVWTA